MKHGAAVETIALLGLQTMSMTSEEVQAIT